MYNNEIIYSLIHLKYIFIKVNLCIYRIYVDIFSTKSKQYVITNKICLSYYCNKRKNEIAIQILLLHF